VGGGQGGCTGGGGRRAPARMLGFPCARPSYLTSPPHPAVPTRAQGVRRRHGHPHCQGAGLLLQGPRHHLGRRRQARHEAAQPAVRGRERPRSRRNDDDAGAWAPRRGWLQGSGVCTFSSGGARRLQSWGVAAHNRTRTRPRPRPLLPRPAMTPPRLPWAAACWPTSRAACSGREPPCLLRSRASVCARRPKPQRRQEAWRGAAHCGRPGGEPKRPRAGPTGGSTSTALPPPLRLPSPPAQAPNIDCRAARPAATLSVHPATCKRWPRRPRPAARPACLGPRCPLRRTARPCTALAPRAALCWAPRCPARPPPNEHALEGLQHPK
jgi:hypothetical protein